MSDAPSLIVTMPVPPSTNKLWARAPGGRRVRSAAYSAWLREAGWELRRQMTGIEPLACRFNAHIQVPVSRRDTGNYEKPVMDCCEHAGVFVNDGNAHQITIEPIERADVRVALWPLPEMGGVRKAMRTRPPGAAWKRRSKPGLTWKEPKRG